MKAMRRLEQGQGRAKCVLVTGATGYLGRLVTATLLRRTDHKLLLPIREHRSSVQTVKSIVEEARHLGFACDPGWPRRLAVFNVGLLGPSPDILAIAQKNEVREIVHCAGQANYTSRQNLHDSNVRLTERMVELARCIQVERFFHLSTAFSSGLINDVIRECLHKQIAVGPTYYMESKRQSEWAVASGGIPYVIIRPGIVIGDSISGAYRGRPLGVYQVWSAGQRYLFSRAIDEVRMPIADTPIPLIHADMFAKAFWLAYAYCRPNSILNIVSPLQGCPTLRDMMELWFEVNGRPESVLYMTKRRYAQSSDLGPAHKAFYRVAGANLAIACHPWYFVSSVEELGRKHGVALPRTSLASVKTCLRRFLDGELCLRG